MLGANGGVAAEFLSGLFNRGTLFAMSEQATPEQINEIGAALAAGRKIDAIKLYREASGADLKEAKDFVEALDAGLRAEDPERFASVAANNKGCGTTAVLLVACVMSGLVWCIHHLG